MPLQREQNDFIIKPYEAEKVIKSVKAVLKLDKE